VTQLNSQPYIFVGLGNPGSQYELTRHNIGHLVIKSLATQLGWQFKEEKYFNALIAKGVIENKPVHLLLPLTYMNLSGTAIRRYLDFFKFSSSHLIVVTDDISLSFGKFRLKTMGSAGGHNGLKSVESCLGTSHYNRLKMGIGHPGARNLADYVLGVFTQEELQVLTSFVDRGVEILFRLLKESVSQVMNAVNTTPSKDRIMPLPKKQIALEKESIDLTKPPLQG
jgi:PTH1 family peptidyl-tRNA hydrolase